MDSRSRSTTRNQDLTGLAVNVGDVVSSCATDAVLTTGAAAATGVAETGVGALGAAAVGCATGAALNYFGQLFHDEKASSALDVVFYLGYIADAVS